MKYSDTTIRFIDQRRLIKPLKRHLTILVNNDGTRDLKSSDFEPKRFKAGLAAIWCK